MPQPKQSPTTPKAPVRGDATADPARAVAPGASVEDAVATTEAPAEGAAAKAKATKPKAATSKTTTPKPKKPGTAKPTAARPGTAKPTAAKPRTATSKAAKDAPKPAAAEPAKPGRAAARPKAAPKGRAPKPAPKPPRAAAGRAAAEPAPAPEPTSAAARDEAVRANLASLRDLLAGGVVLTAQRLQDAVDEAVTRGRITRRDAEDLATGLLSAGRQQTADLLAELEQLLGRGRSDLSSARSITKGAVQGSSDRVLREVDKARRAAGLGSAFPILGYDELTPAQITPRLGDLTPGELRKVRTYEKRHADRAPVIAAVDMALG